MNAEVMHFTSINKNSSVPTIEILIEKLAVKETEPGTKEEQETGSTPSPEPTESGENADSNE